MRKTDHMIADFDPNGGYNNTELQALADDLLREDARTELCRDCGCRGDETGETVATVQEATDARGNPLVIDWPVYGCKNGHEWAAGEGAVRGIGGQNPILFEEHFQSRRRREIYNSLGSPDPAIVSGLYNRSHPQGRKVNSPEARAKHGASYYR